MLNTFKNNYHRITYFLLYISLIVGFIFNENVTNGPYKDLQYTLKQVEIFSNEFWSSFINYDKIEYPNRLSPIYIAVLTLFKKVFIDLDLIRLIFLHIFILTQYYFYKCLKIINFKNFKIDKKILFLLSCSIFLSPNFRANAIWIESSMFGLLFFLVSLYYFLKNYKFFKRKNVYLNIIFLAISAYLRPSYCLFAIYFTYIYFFEFRDKINILKIFLLNFFLAFPAFYYVFILDVFFISFGGLNHNYFNKFGIIASIFIFHSIPFLIFKKKESVYIPILIISSLATSLIIIYNFDYNLDLGGGGIFLHLSNFIFDNDFLFFIFLPIFFYIIFSVINLNFRKNLILISVIFLITPQYHIFHKYYDPLVYILCFTLIDLKIDLQIYNKIKFVLIYFNIILFHYFISFINTYFVNF